MHKLYRVRFDSKSHFHTCIEIIYNLYVSKYVLQLLQGSLATHAICGTDPNGSTDDGRSSSVVRHCPSLSVVRRRPSSVVVHRPSSSVVVRRSSFVSVVVRRRSLSVVIRRRPSCVVVVRRRGREGCEWGDELAGGGIYSPGPFLSLAVGVVRRVCAIFVAFAPLSSWASGGASTPFLGRWQPQWCSLTWVTWRSHPVSWVS
jgi:hypothetical protein